MDLTEAVEAAAIAWFEHDDGLPIWAEDAEDCERDHARSEVTTAVYAAAPLIEAQVRASIAAEFDTLAARLTFAMDGTENPNARSLYRDRRAQMATAAQMVRGRVGA